MYRSSFAVLDENNQPSLLLLLGICDIYHDKKRDERRETVFENDRLGQYVFR